MDNVTVDVGSDPAAIAEGDEAVLLGRDGDERITAEALARRIDTINYEITTALTARPTRAYHRDGAVLDANGRPDPSHETLA